MQIKLGAIKSYKDVLTGCKGSTDGTVVNSKSDKVNSANKYANFDTDASVSYIPSGAYLLHTDTSKLASYFEVYGGCMDETTIGAGSVDISASQPVETTAPATSQPGTASTDVTSATGTVTTNPATGDSSPDNPGGGGGTGAVQTGGASMALIILLVLVSATAGIYFARKRVK